MGEPAEKAGLPIKPLSHSGPEEAARGQCCLGALGTRAFPCWEAAGWAGRLATKSRPLIHCTRKLERVTSLCQNF